MDTTHGSVQNEVTLSGQKGGALTVFDDVNPTNSVEEETVGPVRSLGDFSDGMNSWLKRAQLIQTYTWASTTPLGFWVSFNPWTYIATNPVISNKLQYFSSLRGNLRVRIICNGTPFHYGRLTVGYVPLAPLMSPLQRVRYEHTAALYQVQYVEINPTTSVPQELKIPFISDTDAIPLQGQTATSLANLGTAYVHVSSLLRSANAALPDDVSVQIYAWWEDIEYGVPTPDVAVLQAGNEQIGTGPVSKVATAVATTASYFKNIPFIGRFATAAEMGAKAVSGIASLFGYSNPVLVERYQMFKEQSAINYCQTTGRDSSKKFTLDPLNQLSVDPGSCGMPSRDEMAFARLYPVELYMRSISWAIATVPSTVLAVIPVTPYMFNYQSATKAIPNPVALLAATSQNWSGSLKFRFQVINSAYHKGRIQFRYVPKRVGASVAGYGQQTAQTCIMDIGIDSEKEIVVNWSSPSLWLPTGYNSAIFDSNTNSTTGFASGTPYFANGEIIIEVLTTLSAPQLVAPVDIHVYMSGCDDLRFNNWDNHNLTAYNIALQAGDGDAELVKGNLKSVQFGGKSVTPSSLTKVTMGEEIASLRALFKRPCPMGHNTTRANGTAIIGYASVSTFYPLRTSGELTAEKPFGAYRTTFLDLWKHAFVGYKGAIRYKILRFPTRNNTLYACVATRTNGQFCKLNMPQPTNTAAGVPSTVVYGPMIRGWTDFKPTESVVEIEVPDYNPKKFWLSGFGLATGTSYISNQIDGVQIDDHFATLDTTASGAMHYEILQSTGEDFSLLYFLGCPQFTMGTYAAPTGGIYAT